MAKPQMPVYTERLDQAIEAVEQFKVIAHGHTFCDRDAWLNFWTFSGGIAYETDKGRSFPLTAKNGAAKYLHVTLYRMQSGRYEITAYVS